MDLESLVAVPDPNFNALSNRSNLTWVYISIMMES
jgi:hypothetical protein